MGKLAAAVAGAQVDLNPHQVDAALFAFKSPFSNGAILADEVGLGKTIEAGILLSQRWAERKRRILVITPSNLRKQWSQELDGTAEEWTDDPTEIDLLSDSERHELQAEAEELKAFAELAFSIQSNAKGHALLKVLGKAFEKTKQHGGAEKAIIFTESLQDLEAKTQNQIQRQISERNAQFFEDEANKQIKALESHRKERRRSLFDAQDNIDEKRESLIAIIEGKLQNSATTSDLFTIKWVLE